jgi:cold shock protein
MDRQRGVVRWYDPKKGFGFINSGEVSVFVSFSEVITSRRPALTRGNEVEFSLFRGSKGPVARDVVIIA